MRNIENEHFALRQQPVSAGVVHPQPGRKRTRKSLVGILVLTTCVGVVLLVGCKPSEAPKGERSSQAGADTNDSVCRYYTYKVVRTYPHDAGAFTQGLVFENGFLYEGTGLYGSSTVRKVELQTGRVVKTRGLPDEYFGEGITIFGDRIIQLTWQSHVGFVYDKESFALLGGFEYPAKGWGITHDGERLIMSDGSSTLRFWDPITFRETGRLEVADFDGPVEGLNELEYVKGRIYANVWLTDRIVIISEKTGRVEGWIDLDGLLEPNGTRDVQRVLNGIAYDERGDRLFVTGKRWPKLFHIELVPVSLRPQ